MVSVVNASVQLFLRFTIRSSVQEKVCYLLLEPKYH